MWRFDLLSRSGFKHSALRMHHSCFSEKNSLPSQSRPCLLPPAGFLRAIPRGEELAGGRLESCQLICSVQRMKPHVTILYNVISQEAGMYRKY